eukprot:455786-Pyramimonas_sp.AAC.1
MQKTACWGEGFDGFCSASGAIIQTMASAFGTRRARAIRASRWAPITAAAIRSSSSMSPRKPARTVEGELAARAAEQAGGPAPGGRRQ